VFSYYTNIDTNYRSVALTFHTVSFIPEEEFNYGCGVIASQLRLLSIMLFTSNFSLMHINTYQCYE